MPHHHHHWDVIFYRDTTNWGTPSNWRNDYEVLRTSIKSHHAHKVETFTITFDNVNDTSAQIQLHWNHQRVTIPLTVPTIKKTLKQIIVR